MDKNIKNINNSYKIINSNNNDQVILKSYNLSFKNLPFISGQYLLLYYLDWVSFYLAMLFRTDPTPVNSITKLKNMG